MTLLRPVDKALLSVSACVGNSGLQGSQVICRVDRRFCFGNTFHRRRPLNIDCKAIGGGEQSCGPKFDFLTLKGIEGQYHQGR